MRRRTSTRRAAWGWAVLIAAVALLPRPGHAGELVVNGGFDTGSFGTAWVHGAFRGNNTNSNLADHVVLPDLPYAGAHSALLGFKYTTQTTEAVGYMYQTVAIPANVSSARLYFKVRQQGYDSTPYDPFVAQIRRTNNTVLQTVLSQTFPEYNNQFKDSGWIRDDGLAPDGYNVAAYAGQTVRLYFQQANTIDALYETWTFVDDVSLVYRMWVDLIASSNGDDVFGALGSGAGGLAIQSGVAGDTLGYDVTVQNEGTVNDTYALSLTPPAGWAAWIEVAGVPRPFPYTTPSISAGAAQSYRVFLAAPAAAAVNSYNVVLNAVSTAQGTRLDSATLRAVIAAAHHATDLVVDGNGFGVVGTGGSGGFALKEAPWDSLVTYSLELHNTGDAATTYQISMSPAAGASATVRLAGTPYTTSFVTPSVAPAGALAMTLEVRVAQPNLGGDYPTVVQATAVQDLQRVDTVRAVLRLRAPRVDMIIGANGNGIYDGAGTGLGGSSTTSGARGTAILFPLVVQNEASQADAFRLTWSGPGGGWTASLLDGGTVRAFPYTTPSIAPHSEVAYTLRIVIPAGVAYGTYPSIVTAVSQRANQVSESITAAVSVSDASQGVDMTIDGVGAGVYGPIGTGLGGSSTVTASPGDTTRFTVNLQSLAGLNSMNLSWNTPAGWSVTFDGTPSPVTGKPSGVYVLRAIVPASSLGGTFDIILDAQKSDKPFYMDSVIGRINVNVPVLVDAVLDGNGDDVFGPAGSGLGGQSAQLHSAPVTLSYTLELQNQGGAADQYAVSWNAILGFTATLNGSPPPVTTASIGPGSSRILSFIVTVPSSAVPGNFDYLLDVVSLADPGVTESVRARATLVNPPRADLVIDGNGTNLFGTARGGDGGLSVRAADPGAFYTAALTLRNAGSFADSFYVDLQLPAAWPAGSIVIHDGLVDHSSPFWSASIAPGGSLDYTVKVQVPNAVDGGFHRALIDARSSLPPNQPESVALVTQTVAVVTGVVFDDRDHGGSYTAGDIPLEGVTVRELATGQTQLSGGDGRYTFFVGSTAVTLVEQNPSGFVSTSPDTVGPAALSAGDTLQIDFGDVRPLRLSEGVVLGGVAGTYVDFPHRLDAGTAGQVDLEASSDAGVIVMILLDENRNGIFDGNDRIVQPADLAMGPAPASESVWVLVRAFVPAAVAPGTTLRIDVTATQPIAGTPLTTSAAAMDAVVVIAGTVGRVALHKQVDTDAAQPGDVLTYTISFVNTGVDSVRNIVILDPISEFVEPMTDAFGPGVDMEWTKPGAGVFHLTLDPGDGDECEFSANERILRVFLSKNTPFYLQAGESGTLNYRVIVR